MSETRDKNGVAIQAGDRVAWQFPIGRALAEGEAVVERVADGNVFFAADGEQFPKDTFVSAHFVTLVGE
jgi:hypothetical protein